MQPEQAQDFSTLRWVRTPLDETIRQARRALEAHVEGDGADAGMVACAKALHQLNGVLQVVQVYGGAMLVDEMEQVAKAIADGRVGREKDALEALVLGLVQLPAYLERVEMGEPDIPLILLPLLNDLRAARDRPLVSEISLFAPNLEQLINAETVVPGSGNPELPSIIRKNRADFHRGLLSWFRDQDSAVGLRRIRAFLEAVSSQSGTSRLRRILDAADALVVAIQEGTLDNSMAIKLIFGQLDRFLKRVIDDGEEAAVSDFPIELLKNLLYYVALSPSDNPVIEAVRHSADLANTFPVHELSELADDRLGGAGRELFEAVSNALRQDLLQVKDELDLFMRADDADTSRLAGMIEPLRRSADTLGMIGRGELRAHLKDAGDRLSDWADQGERPAEDDLLAVASAILRVESALAGLEPTVKSSQPVAEQSAEQALTSGELQVHVAAAIQEAFVDLSRVRESVSAYLDAPDDVKRLSGLPRRLHSVSGALRILEQPEVAGQLDHLGAYLEGVARGDSTAPDAAQRDALAEIITGIEYYLEAVQEGRPGEQEILDFTQQAVRRLNVGDLLTKMEEAPAAQPQAQPVEPVAAAAQPVSEDVDQEILDIFLEETEEELERIQEFYPRWRADQQDQEALQTVRRSFHTLKGSGRLVGALTIGEFAWSIENLFNRIIDNTIAITDQVLALLDEAVAMLPEMVAAQATGTVPQVDHAAIEARAFELASGMPQEGGSVAPAGEAGVVASPEPAAAEESSTEEVSDAERAALETDEAEVAAELADLDELVSTPLEEIELPDLEMPELDVSSHEQLVSEEEDLEEITLDADSVPALAEESIEITPPAEETVDREPQTGPVAGEERHEVDASELQEEEAQEPESILLMPESEPETEPEIEPEPAAITLDPALAEIFGNEAKVHLQTLADFLAECDTAPCEPTDALARALHTLRGSAHMAQVDPVAEVAGAAEDLVNLLRQHGRRAESPVIRMLQEVRDTIRAVLDVINVPGSELPSWMDLQSALQASRAALEEEIERQAAVDAISQPSEVVDEELLEIFLEEARELFEQLEAAYGRWVSKADDEALLELQRALHTFKGGARLAGLVQLGDLSHAMESLFDALVEGRVPADETVHALVRSGIDQLAVETDRVERRQVPGDTSALVHAMESAARGELAAAAETVSGTAVSTPSDEEVLSEPVSEPQPEVEESILMEEVDSSLEEASSLLADSSLIRDSQLLTDSELLGETDFFEDSQATFETSEGESRIIRFPGSELEEGADVPRRLPPEPEAAEPASASQEQVRVRADLLDQLVNSAGEISIYRSRMEQQNLTLGFNLQELGQTTARLRDQLRHLEMETEAQILARFEREREEQEAVEGDFDPLEMDRYSTIQQLSRSLVETVTDLASIGDALEELGRDTDTLLLQQARVGNDLQDGLLRTRMVPFGTQVNRLQRVVRQAAQTTGRQAELVVNGAEGEVDRSILGRILGPLEHLLRNAVAHGIEPVAGRRAAGKPDTGRIELSVSREGPDVLIRVQDDGAGLDLEAIRERAIAKGMLDPQAEVSDADLQQFVLEPGFSTADEVTQVAGRGVGMDAVLSDVKQLGGSLDLSSETGHGLGITIRLPFTLSISEALLVTVGDDVYAVPHANVDGVARISREDLLACYEGRKASFEYLGQEYLVRYLGAFIDASAAVLPESQKWFPILLSRVGDHRVALHVDSLIGNRQVVTKSVGVQLSTVRSISGGTILADGRVALILDIKGLVHIDTTQPVMPVEPVETVEEAAAPEATTVMVVDDSITVRKVTSRLLERHNMNVVTAKDGVDAVTLLEEHHPSIMLLDIEMPRMDGFELARHMRNTPELQDIPIIMITSRTGEKHRQRAMDLGVQRYLGKPYQENELLDNIYTVLAEAGHA